VVVAAQVVATGGRRLARGIVAVDEAFAAIVRFLQPVALDHRAHRPVDHQDALAQRGLEERNALRMEPPALDRGVRIVHVALLFFPGPGSRAPGPGFIAIIEITSKCGGRFSRVTVSALSSSRPARATKRRRSLSPKPRLACP